MRRILAVLLAMCMMQQCTLSVAAEVTPAENVPVIEQEEEIPITDQSNIQPESERGDVSLYTVEGMEENVAQGAPLYDYEIEWDNKEPEYWDNIDWSTIYWDALSYPYMNYTFPAGWSDNVEWRKVNWNYIDWGGYSAKKTAWQAINWDNVDWDKMNWNMVSWSALKELQTASEISLTFTYPNAVNNELTAPVTATKLNNIDVFTILSSDVLIGIKGANALKSTLIPEKAYIITVKNNNDTYKLKGIWNRTNPWGDYISEGFFESILNTPEIKDGKAAITNEDYWIIKVNDSDCTFASKQTQMPKVSIKSFDGTVTLEEGQDYTVTDGTYTQDENSLVEDSHRLIIEALPTSSKVGPGTVNKKFTVHYADINDFYTLEGIPKTITAYDTMPKRATEVNQKGKKKEADLQGCLYLQPKDNDSLQSGQLPKISQDGYYDHALWNAYPVKKGSPNPGACLNVEYGYERGKGVEWSPSFDWDEWSKKRTSDTVYIRVSVNDSGASYPKPDESTTLFVGTRFIKGSIISSVQIIPYSLEEVNKEQKPATTPLNNGDYYIAAVNPVPIEFTDSRKYGYERIDERVIDSVTYNGKTHTPDITWSVYKYSDFSFGGGKHYDDYDASLLNPNITYENNINAGTGKVRISFYGVFTGSITRDFQIEQKDISDTSITIQAQDFLYDGNPHAPILAIFDSQANTVLREGVDYTVRTSGNITSPGTVTATIEGINNYTGTRTVQYKIVPTSTVVVGTKLEQVADIPDKIDDQKYTGQPVTPEVVITGKNSSFKLVKDKDYKVSYLNNIGPGTAYAVVEGIGSYGGTYIIPFNINGADISKATVTVNGTYTYTGKAITPSVTVKVGDKIIEPADYEIKATNNINAGTAKFTVIGRNNCTGTTGESTFKIKKANQKLSITKEQAKALLIRNTNANTYKIKVSGAKAKLSYKVSNKKIASVDSAGKLSFKHVCGKAFVTVSTPASENYNAAALKINFAVKPATPKIKITALTKGFKAEATVIRDITGYQVGYSTSKSFPTSKTVKKRVDTTKALNKGFTGLSGKKKYYVRVRAYKIASDGTVYWGNWTKREPITTK